MQALYCSMTHFSSAENVLQCSITMENCWKKKVITNHHKSSMKYF